jgi:type VI secretion system protein ImpL
MKKFVAFLIHPGTLAVFGLAIFAALVWWVGPLIAFGRSRPLDGMWERIGTIAVVALLVVVVMATRSWRRRRAAAALMKGMKQGPSAADKETELLSKRFAEALEMLEQTARQSGRRSFFRRDAYLYDLPWYVFIGAPGSGKTTALLNAGLTFPLAGKMGSGAIKGVGGTRHCDWWFTEQAVLIDTAGRYTLQQSDEQVDASGWQGFLEQLKKARPRRPINGVLLTVNVQDLLQQPPAERKEHALKLRTRLQELHDKLGIRPPVYVLVTKADLLAGFNDSFGNLGAQDRDQVWGFTFPVDAAGQGNPLQNFPSEYGALEKRLRDQLLERIEAQHEVLPRAAIFSFPQQFSGLKGLLGGFLEQVFEGGAGLEERPLLRGVYFTSGTQEGTPIDRVLGTLARTFGVEQKAASIAGARGKSYFLSRLLKDVVFAEQGLVGVNRAAESRRRKLRLAAMAAIATLSVAVAAGWALSYMRNQAYLGEVEAKLPEIRKAVDALPPAGSGGDVAFLPQVLDLLNNAPRSASFDIEDPPLAHGLGLYQGRYVKAGAQLGYRQLLDQALLPRVTQRLEERLRAASGDNLEFAYEALKSYLMLYTPDRFDAEALRAWVSIDWDANLANVLSAEQRAALGNHLQAALSRGAPAAVPPMDKELVTRVREMLVAFPLEFRVFSRLKRAGVGGDYPEFSVAGAAGPNALQVFERASGQPLTKGVPGLFTRDGYHKGFRNATGSVVRQLADEQSWVLGIKAPAGSAKDAAAQALTMSAEVDERVRRLYLQEYIKTWDQFIADVRLVKLGGIDRSMAVSRLLAAPDSPLTAYLRAVARETQLTLPPEQKVGGSTVVGKVDQKLDKAKQELSALVGKVAAPSGAPKGPPLETMVDQHFASLHRMVAGTPAPIEETQKLFNEVFVQLSAIDAAQKAKTPPPPGGGAAAKAAAAMQPEPIKSMLETLIDAGASQGRAAERQGLTAEVKPIAEFCARTIAGRYPFATGSKADVLPDDFGQMFGAGGLMDDFFQKRLAALVDTSPAAWVYRPLPDGSKPPGGAALVDFQRAARIKEAFFRAGGKVPGFKIDLRVVEMAEGLKELTLDVDGQALKFVAGNTAAQTLAWPSTKVASMIRLSAPGTGVQTFEGPWALFRLFNQFEVQPSPQPERFTVVLQLDGRKARLEVISASAINPLRMREIQTFRCPEAL